MELRWILLEQAVTMCTEGGIVQAGTLAAVLLTAQRRGSHAHVVCPS